MEMCHDWRKGAAGLVLIGAPASVKVASFALCFCFIVIRTRSLALLLFPRAICLSTGALFSIRLFIFGARLTPAEPLFSCLSVLHKSHCVQYLIMCF